MSKQPKNAPKKVYYFICMDCHQRKPRSEEAFFKAGICQPCYDLAFDEAEEEIEE